MPSEKVWQMLGWIFDLEPEPRMSRIFYNYYGAIIIQIHTMKILKAKLAWTEKIMLKSFRRWQLIDDFQMSFLVE